MTIRVFTLVSAKPGLGEKAAEGVANVDHVDPERVFLTVSGTEIRAFAEVGAYEQVTTLVQDINAVSGVLRTETMTELLPAPAEGAN